MSLTPQERLELLRQYGKQQEEEEKSKNSFGLPRLKLEEAPTQAQADDFAVSVLLVPQPNYRTDVPTLPYVPYFRYSFACLGKPWYVFNGPQSFQFPDGTQCTDPVQTMRLRAAATGDEETVAAIREQSRHQWYVINLDNIAAGVHTLDLPVASGNALYQMWMTYMRREGVDLTDLNNSKIVSIAAYKATNGFRQYVFNAFRSGSMQELASNFQPKGADEIQIADVVKAFHAKPLCDLFYVYGPETLTEAVNTGNFDKEKAKEERKRLAEEHGGYPVPTACMQTVTGERIPTDDPAPAPVKQAPADDALPFSTIGQSKELELEERIQVLDGDNWVDVVITEKASDGSVTAYNEAADENYRVNPAEDEWRYPPKPATPVKQEVARKVLQRSKATPATE